MSVAGIGMTSRRTRARMINRLREQGIRNESVLAAVESVPRHLFVQEALSPRAYEDTALPLSFSQTISQPYIVARMLEILLEGRALGKTLEIGTGSGYQAALLALLTREVFSVERIEGLLEEARNNLKKIRQFRVRLKYGDGSQGLPKAAPFDTIIFAAAARGVPEAVREQLAPDGKMLLPLDNESGRPKLLLVERRGATNYLETFLEDVRFVPLVAGIA
ncbi:MAG: protein-L-isoaspartate(D-aspartate) O-methyltransferase [Candidatus Accumulibacter sp.]|jgi:protein-L-isoaspartate(D-aspartate) O-methyltransferase|nr:protein-L-isoaspartate(D-aspartate) O-methyltransferase [Accumulibacter sp.]